MNLTKSETNQTFALTWSLSADKDKLELNIQIQPHEEMFVADRLWVYTPEGEVVGDPWGVYRFAMGNSLRLVFADSPCPPNISPQILFEPRFSKIKQGAIHRIHVSIKLPIDEYSALARDVDSPHSVEMVNSVTLIIAYRTQKSLGEEPSPPYGETGDNAGYLVFDPEFVVSTMEVPALPVRKRTGYIARFALPGEPEPEPIPLNVLFSSSSGEKGSDS
ncbi:MAG: hypothetical protein IPK82_02675 [Polyangiaceae bacterium]|nr:hypothetical protein [Polyangiaceae bacterium]